MLDPIHLQTFLIVAECRSFSEASRRLGISQPSVSDHVRKLEAALGRRLFQRDTHSVTLTLEGDELVEFARNIVETNIRVKNHFSGVKLRSRVRFGASEDLVWSWLPGVLSDFIRRNPSVDLEFEIDFSNRLVAKFDAGELDVVLCKRWPGQERGERLWSDELVWAAATPEPVISNGQLQLVLYPPPAITRYIALTALEKAEVPWRVVCTSGNLSGLAAAAKVGLGIICFVKQFLPEGLVACAPSDLLPALGETEFVVLRTRGSRNEPAIDDLSSAIEAKAKSTR